MNNELSFKDLVILLISGIILVSVMIISQGKESENEIERRVISKCVKTGIIDIDGIQYQCKVELVKKMENN